MTSYQFRTTTATDAGFSAEVLTELGDYIDAKVMSGDLVGHVLLLAKGDSIIRGHSAGFVNLASTRPVKADTIYSVYSMTKPMTAVAMLLLYEEGKWQLDDPIADYLSEFREIYRLEGSQASRGPTIRETFTHTAGFVFGKTREEMLAYVQKLSPHTARSLTDLISRYANMPLGYEPGTRWEYGIATDLQAEIVERLTGERIDLFLKRRLFDPLGMNDTGFVVDPSDADRLARGHVVEASTGALRLATPEEEMTTTFPMGGTSFASTALDYARFARMLLNRGSLGDVRILQATTVDLMLANHLPDTLLEQRHGIGHHVVGLGNGHALNGLVCLDPIRANRPVGKGTYEWGGAFGSWFWIDPENDLLCVGMTNRKRDFADVRPLEIVAQELVYKSLRSFDRPE